DRAVANDVFGCVLPSNVWAAREQALEECADFGLARVGPTPDIGAFSIAELAVVGKGVHDRIDVTAGECIADFAYAFERDRLIDAFLHDGSPGWSTYVAAAISRLKKPSALALSIQ